MIPERQVEIPTFDSNREGYLEYADKVKRYLNSRQKGMGDLMTKAEAEKNPILKCHIEWDPEDEAPAALHDFLLTTCTGKVRNISNKEQNGFEAWRKIAQEFDPRGGAREVDSYNRVFRVSRVKHLRDFPHTIRAWELEVDHREEKAKTLPMSEAAKISTTLAMLPAECEGEVRWTFNNGPSATYASMRDEILQYVQLNVTGNQPAKPINNFEQPTATDNATKLPTWQSFIDYVGKVIKKKR